MKEELKLSLDNYISDEYSICREERQYALYLNNVLKRYGGEHRPEGAEDLKFLSDIFHICKIPKEAIIVDVFYEATFMRDIFERDRRIREFNYRKKKHNSTIESAIFSKNYRISEHDYDDDDESFNQKLLEYLLSVDDIRIVGDKNIGHNEIDKIYQGKLKHDDKITMARYMMNSKPDIAVIYRIEKDFYLLFLECKFESNEDKRNLGKGKISQSKIQYEIANFICSHEEYGAYEGKQLKVASAMKNKKASILVGFSRKEETEKINIKNLIQLNEKIFNK
jgi:hypothetical protein